MTFMDSPIYTSNLSPLRKAPVALTPQETRRRDNDYLRRLAVHKELSEVGVMLKDHAGQPARRVILAPGQFDTPKVDQRVTRYVKNQLVATKVTPRPLKVAKGRTKLTDLERKLEYLAHSCVNKKQCVSILSSGQTIIIGDSSTVYDPNLGKLRTALDALQAFNDENAVRLAIQTWQQAVHNKYRAIRNPNPDRLKTIICDHQVTPMIRLGIYLDDTSANADEISANLITAENQEAKVNTMARAIFQFSQQLIGKKIVIAPNVSADWLRPMLVAPGIEPVLALTKKDSQHLHSQIHGIENRKPALIGALKKTYRQAGFNKPNKKRIHSLAHAALTDSHCAEPNVLVTDLTLQGAQQGSRLVARQATEKPGLSTALCGSCKHVVSRMNALKETGIDFTALSLYANRTGYNQHLQNIKKLNHTT